MIKLSSKKYKIVGITKEDFWKKLNGITVSTILSILVFFSTSFISVLTQINSPWFKDNYTDLKIGFPFEYYHEFMVDCSQLNYGWNLNHLFFDCALCWFVVSGTYWLIKRKR